MNKGKSVSEGEITNTVSALVVISLFSSMFLYMLGQVKYF